MKTSRRFQSLLELSVMILIKMCIYPQPLCQNWLKYTYLPSSTLHFSHHLNQSPLLTPPPSFSWIYPPPSQRWASLAQHCQACQARRAPPLKSPAPCLTAAVFLAEPAVLSFPAVNRPWFLTTNLSRRVIAQMSVGPSTNTPMIEILSFGTAFRCSVLLHRSRESLALFLDLSRT